MGKDLAEAYPAVAKRFAKADELLGFSLTQTMFEGPMEELTRTSRCQPALYVHGLACWELLQQRLPELKAVAAAGLSLGEFTAHAAAGTLQYKAGLDLVAKRGAFMEDAANASGGSMAALIGGTEKAVRILAAQCDVDVANYNAPSQIVISGSKEGITEAIGKAKEHGVKIAKELVVGGAYHSRLMQPAQDRLVHELAHVALSKPNIPVICNVEAREVTNLEDIRQTLAAQVTGSVRWSESMTLLLERGHKTFIEFGPGGVLAGLMKRIDREATVICVEGVDSLEAAVAALR